jgi:hypothetical protein
MEEVTSEKWGQRVQSLVHHRKDLEVSEVNGSHRKL